MAARDGHDSRETRYLVCRRDIRAFETLLLSHTSAEPLSLFGRDALDPAQ